MNSSYLSTVVRYDRSSIAGSVVVLLMASAALGQTSSTKPGFMLQGPAESTGAPVIRDALNRPCLDVEAAARRQVINKDMVDHVVSIKNNCARPIKVRVCYFNSEHCNQLDARPYNRIDTILGSMRGNTYFRYTLQQK